MTKRDLEAVGLHSLFSEADRNGTDRERHVSQLDLDSKEPLLRPREFREDALRAMRAHGLMDLYLFETRKGVHGWSPWLQSRRFAERFETAFFNWKGDDFHAQMGWKNGGTVLRFTPKPGEGDMCAKYGRAGANVPPDRLEELLCRRKDCETCYGTGWTGPRYVAHFRLPPALLAPWSFWSKTHYEFMAARYKLPEHVRPVPEGRGVECDGLRVERYYTYAPNQEPKT